MKRALWWLVVVGWLVSACGSPVVCNDPLGCVRISSGEPITIAVALTLSGPVAPYGVDALRGVELAIADRGGKLLNHPIELIQEDDQCSAEGGRAAAERLAQNPKIIGVIGATCSSASIAAAEVLSPAGLVLISPSSTAASLTAESTHQAGFLRTIQNDKNQARTVAEFVYRALGLRKMAIIHDGTPYPTELSQEACSVFEAMGGNCVADYLLESGTNPIGALEHIQLFGPEALYYPVYLQDGVAITRQIAQAGLSHVALISSDGLLSSDFLSQAGAAAEGMYVSGPAMVEVDPSFYAKYEARYGEKPIAAFAPYAYDATMMLFEAFPKASRTTGRDIYLHRQALRNALYATRNFSGVTGVLTCSPLGDCALPNVIIYQVRRGEFTPIYP